MAILVFPIQAIKKCVIIETEERYMSRIPLVKMEFKHCLLSTASLSLVHNIEGFDMALFTHR